MGNKRLFDALISDADKIISTTKTNNIAIAAVRCFFFNKIYRKLIPPKQKNSDNCKNICYNSYDYYDEVKIWINTVSPG